MVESSARLTCDMPGAGNNLVKSVVYRVGAIVGGQTIMSDFEYRYQRQTSVGSCDYDNTI